MNNAYLELLEKQDEAYALRINKAIQLACKAWLAWVDAGTPHGPVMFSTHKGLCDNVMYWMMESGHSYDERCDAVGAMSGEFYTRYGSTAFPFGGGAAFHKEQCEGTTHLNEMRLAWAREKAVMLEEENV